MNAVQDPGRNITGPKSGTDSNHNLAFIKDFSWALPIMKVHKTIASY
ncbi:uncharacterized protein METZ01_LOCUS195313 [marine metagenome]|uniref:Uncharacterized protein n=1 Tax=marine metagenome TaxID=408172 RepID=A0A382DWE5_9ZZZZ